MNKHLSFAAVLLASLIGSAHAGVNVSVAVGEPGFYGVIDVGNAPPPVVYRPQPIEIQATPMPMPPVYLRVPREHRAHWKAHCAEYNACGRPVYFVDERWYARTYAPHYQHHQGFYQERRDFEERREHDHGHDRDHDHHEHEHHD